MHRPKEHGNVISSVVLGAFSIFNGIILQKNFLSIIFWIPIWLGLFLYDDPINNILHKENLILFFMIVFTAIISILYNIFLLIPYLVFFFVYFSRIFFSKKRAGYTSVILGLFGYSTLFSFSWLAPGRESIVITITLFLFMLGSEFLVRSVIKKKRYLSFYNFITLLFIFLNPVFLIYTTSIPRVIFAYTINKVKIIGILESILLIITIILLEGFVIF